MLAHEWAPENKWEISKDNSWIAGADCHLLFFDVALHWGRITGTASPCKNVLSDDVMSEHVRTFELSAEQAGGLRNWRFLHVRVKVQILVRSNFLSVSWLDEHRYLIRYHWQLFIIIITPAVSVEASHYHTCSFSLDVWILFGLKCFWTLKTCSRKWWSVDLLYQVLTQYCLFSVL